MKKILLITLILTFSSIGISYAKNYGMAGCGLGSLVFQSNDTQVSQVFGATTNGTSGSQTFGITSGTSNCTDQGTVAKNKEVPLFIEVNQIALATDSARGEGETIAHLSKALGCPNAGALGATLQKNYHTIFSNENIQSSQVTGAVLDTLKNDPTLSQECAELI